MDLISHASPNLVAGTAMLGSPEADPETLRVWSLRCLLGINTYEEKGKEAVLGRGRKQSTKQG